MSQLAEWLNQPCKHGPDPSPTLSHEGSSEGAQPPPAARLALSRAADLDPKNQAALTALVRLEAEQGYLDTLPAHLVKFLAVRRPSREVLNIAYRRIGSDLNLFQSDQQRLLVELRQRLAQNSTSAPRS